MKAYMNIGIIDARFAQDQTLAQISKLTNIGTLIMTPNQQAASNRIAMTNVGNIITLEKEVSVVHQSGDMTLDDNYLSQLPDPCAFNFNGNVLVHPLKDRTMLDKIDSGIINGNVYATSADFATLTSTCQINGSGIVYKEGDLVIPNRFKLNDIELLGIPAGSSIVTDVLEALEELSDEDISEAIGSLKVNTLIIATKSNIRKLVSKIVNYNQVEKIIAPDDHTYYERLTLDESTLEFLPSRKLFVTGTLNIVANAQSVLEHVDSIIASHVSVSKTDADSIRHLFKDVKNIKVRDPKSIQNMAKTVVTKALLEESDNLSIENMGKLVFAKDIPASLIRSNVSNLVNMGKISCTKEQYTAVLSVCSQNMGAIKDDLETNEGWVDQEEVLISNMEYVKL